MSATTRAPFSRTLSDLIAELAARHGGRPAVVDRGSIVTFDALHRRSLALAGRLRDRGIRRGDRVATLIPNRLEWLEICFATALAGATLVPFSTWSTPAELEYLLADSGAALLFTVDRFGERDFTAAIASLVPELRAELPASGLHAAAFPALRGVVAVGQHDVLPGVSDYASWLEGPALEPLPPGEGASAMDIAMILYTSGSSSRPKAVKIRQHGLVENGFNIGERQGLGPDDRVLLAVPLFWAYGGVNALPAAFTHGAALVLQERMEAGAALDLIETQRCTAIYTLPGMTRALLDHPAFTPARTATLVRGLTIGTPQDVASAAQDLGVRQISNIYGSSETYGNCCVTWSHWPLERRMACQGHPLPGMEVRIVDPATGVPLAVGETGAVEVRGFVTPGYAGDSAKFNATAFTADGFFRMGDLGLLQADGTFVFVGRHTEMIKASGINVSPVEIEEVLLRHPAISEAGVVGVPDPVKGERIVAFVVAKPAETVESKALALHCRQHMSSYKVPDLFVTRDRLPTTVTGKLMRADLRVLAAALSKKEAGGHG